MPLTETALLDARATHDVDRIMIRELGRVRDLREQHHMGARVPRDMGDVKLLRGCRRHPQETLFVCPTLMGYPGWIEKALLFAGRGRVKPEATKPAKPGKSRAHRGDEDDEDLQLALRLSERESLSLAAGSSSSGSPCHPQGSVERMLHEAQCQVCIGTKVQTDLAYLTTCVSCAFAHCPFGHLLHYNHRDPVHGHHCPSCRPFFLDGTWFMQWEERFRRIRKHEERESERRAWEAKRYEPFRKAIAPARARAQVETTHMVGDGRKSSHPDDDMELDWTMWPGGGVDVGCGSK